MDWKSIMMDMASKSQGGEEPVSNPENTNLNTEEGLEPQSEVENPEQEQEVEINKQVEENTEEENSGNAANTETEDNQETELDLDNISDWLETSNKVDPSEENKGLNIDSFVSQFDLKKEDVKDEKSLIESISNKIKSYEEKINEIKENTIPDNIPDFMKEAILVASNGGDYESYLGISSVDYDKISNEDLIANSIVDNFKDESGAVNEDELYNYLDSLTDTQVKIEGNRIRENLKSHVKSQKDYIVKKSEDKRNEIIQKVNTSLSELDNIMGFKIQEHQKDDVRKAVKNDNILAEMFYTNGSLDPGKLVKSYIINKNFDKMVNYLKNTTKSKVKIDMLNEAQNSEINSRSTPPNPVVDTQEESPLSAWIKQLKGE